MTGETGGRPPVAGRVVQLAPTPSGVAAPVPLTGPAGLDDGGPTASPDNAIQLIRGAVGAHLVAAVTGLVGADYVGAAYFSIIVPLLSGLACAWWVSRVAGGLPRAARNGLAGGYAATSAAFAFVYSDTPYGSLGDWLPPLLAGVVGALVWPLVDPAPPRRS